jgi:tetratricopeptide (TPR) repeat protein
MIKNNFGNLYLKMNQPEMAILYFRQALPYALSSKYSDVICESGMGMAKIYEKQELQDSVLHYANTSLAAAKEAKYLTYMLQSSSYLADYYRRVNRLDSAIKYFSMSSSIRDSLHSNDKLNKIKTMEMEHMFREQEREENALKASEERRVNIQYAILLISIVSLLLIALLLSRSFIVHHNWVRFLGVLSLLLVFEFINLYLHPLLDKLTGHSPIAMLLIMAGIASLLIPLHHKMEHWVTNKLVEKNKKIRLAEAKKIIKELES